MKQLNIFEQLGLSRREARIYEVLLRIKRGSVSLAAEQAGINRTTAYDTLEFLRAKGLVLKYATNQKIGYTIDTPKRLRDWIAGKKREIISQEKMLEERLDEIIYRFHSNSDAPQVRYFSGNDRIEDFFEDSLRGRADEILGYSTTAIVSRIFTERFRRYYARERALRNISGRYIVQQRDADTTREYVKKYYGRYLKSKPDLIKCRVLDSRETNPFLNETIVYGDCIAISHTASEFFGVIIKSKDVANTQRIIFENLWCTLKRAVIL